MFKDDDEEEENTFGVTRYPCMPSLVALQQMRNRLHLAFLGRKLMKWTALATGRELRRLAQELYEVYDGFAEDLRNAFILLARSRYFCPSLNGVVSEDVAKKAGVIVQQCGRTVSGVKIVQFEIFETEYPPYPHLGLEKGGQTILETKKAWLELLKRLIMMMQLRAGFLMVELANRNANKKWNVLSKMVIPRVNLSCHYITSELEEIEREDNFRLKRFKELKTKKQRAKEVVLVKTIQEESEVYDQDTDTDSTCSCENNIETPEQQTVSFDSVSKLEIKEDKSNEKRIESTELIDETDLSIKQNKEVNDRDSDKYSVCCRIPSEAKSQIKDIDHKISQPDSKTICNTKKIKSSSELIESSVPTPKHFNTCNKSCQAGSNVNESKYTEIICPTCNTHIQTNGTECLTSCIGTTSEINTSAQDDIRPTAQNQEANSKNVASTCSSSQPADIKLPSDKNTQFVSFDKSCDMINGKESKLKDMETKHSSELISKGDKIKPQEENKDNEKIVESDKESKITMKKQFITIPEKKIPVIKCCSESDMTRNPCHGGSNRTITETKSKLSCQRDQTTGLKPCMSASAEVSKASRSVTVSCDAKKSDQEVQNRSTGSTSQSASVASVDYSCIDKTISVCDIRSESKLTEEAKTTQTSPDAKLEDEKPESRYCTIKIFTKDDSEVPSDEVNNIELTPSTLELLRKILLQGRKPPTSSDTSKSRISPKCDCSTNTSGILKQQSIPICSTDKHPISNKPVEGETTQVDTCLSQLESVKIGGIEMKSVSTETFTRSIRRSPSDVPKHSCVPQVIEPTHSILKKEISGCSCKPKRSVDNTKLKCPCSKSQNEPQENPEQKTCTCSKEQSKKHKCKCNRKQETTTPSSFNAPEISNTSETPKPNLDPICCQKSESSDTASKAIASIASICSKCVSINEAENINYPETKDAATQRSFDSMSKYFCCSIGKSITKTNASECSYFEKKDASTSTRRSDRYDVRPIRLLMQLKKAPNVSLSDSVLVNNEKCRDTTVRKCISSCGRL